MSTKKDQLELKGTKGQVVIFSVMYSTFKIKDVNTCMGKEDLPFCFFWGMVFFLSAVKNGNKHSEHNITGSTYLRLYTRIHGFLMFVTLVESI